MPDPTFQTQYPDGLIVRLDRDCLRFLDAALATVNDDFDGKFRFFAEDFVRSVLGAASIDAYDDIDHRPDLRQHSRVSASSTPSSAASGRFYCRTCDDILPDHKHSPVTGQWVDV